MLLIYGANGYTGQLIVEEAVRAGLRPVLAGRHAERLQPLARQYDLPWRMFRLEGEPLRAGLDGISVVLHAAGPFSRTSAPMRTACLAQRAHYLDITGEIAVFEACRARHEGARDAGIVMLPGVGFDVVPTDCVAATLAAALPGASLLELAFAGGGGFSRGTLKTMLLGGGEGGAIRKDGVVIRVPSAWRTQRIPFRDRPRDAVTIPWGDVSTAHWSTGIPNIHTYLALPKSARRGFGMQGLISRALRVPGLGAFIERQIDRRVAGPSAEVRATAQMQVWGRVTHADGRTAEATAVTPEGYRFTAIAAIASVQRLLASTPAPGYHTPSSAFGADFLTTLPACDIQLR